MRDDDERLLRLVESVLSGSRRADGDPRAGFDGAEERQVLLRLDEIRRIADFHKLLHTTGGTLVPPQTWGRLRILRLLGRGAFADVYLAHDPDLDRDVALKLYRVTPLPESSHFATEGPSISRDHLVSVLREGQLMARVRHPNVVVIHGAEEIDGQVGIWMDYIDGRTLAEFLRLQGPLSAAEATLIALDLCRALAAVHGAGIVHRDVKAQNVMRERGGRIVLMDFGVGVEVRSEDPRSRKPDTCAAVGTSGTPLYMAPETLLDGAASIASDVYSLGVLLFHLVTDEFPVNGSELGEVIEAHRRGRRRLLRDVRPDVPAPFAELVEKALRPTPRERYSSMGEMERAFSTTAGIHAASAPAQGLSPQPVHRQITFIGRVFHPALSPDGRTLAYLWVDDRLEQVISIQDVGGGQPIELIRGKWFWPPVWSPDGSELLLSGHARESSWRETYILPRFGGKPRHYPYAPRVCWLPDGSGFAALSEDLRELTIVNKSTGTSNPVPLGEGFFRIWAIAAAPDPGRFLWAHIDPTGRFSLWVLPGPGQVPHKVLEDSEAPYSPVWSRDGSAIYFIKEALGAYNLYRLPLDRATCRPHSACEVLVTGLQGWQMSLSGDDRIMAYAARTPRSNLWLMELQSGQGGCATAPRPITRGTFAYEGLAISPDGSRVAACRMQGSGAEIHVIRLADLFCEQVTFLGAVSYQPAWSPDGRRIAFLSNHGGSLGVWTMDADGTGIRRLREADSGSSLNWAPSEKILLLLSDHRSLVWLDPGTGEGTPLSLDLAPGLVHSAQPSPDQRSIAVWCIQTAEKREGVWVIPADGSAPQNVYPTRAFPVQWSSDGRSLWIFEKVESRATPYPSQTDGAAGNFRMLRVPAEGGEPLQIVKLPLDRIVTADISPDGSRLVCNVSETLSDIWTVENFAPQTK